MASKTKDEASLNQQVEELRDRMRILQNDRKSNIDVLEANKNSNKEDIRKLRDDNKDLRQKLAQLQKTTGTEESKDEQKHLEREIEKLRKINDDMRNKANRLRKELDIMKDSVKDLELDSQRPHMEDNEYTRRIRALENKLDKAMIKYNEAQSIRKTYEQIARRLTEERVGFDNQLAAIERTLSSKQKDFEELTLLSGDANHARETALGELERVRAGYEEERKKREKELRERHQMVQLRRQMLERMKYRERMRNQLASGAGKPESPNQREMNSLSLKNIQLEKIESRNKVDIFENAFRKIKEATGVSDVNEVIQKIVSQESTTENLIAVTRENQGKIEALNQLRKQIKSHCEDIKYSGVGGGQHRKMVDSFEDQLSNSATRLERSRLKYERLSKVTISMKAGIGHLQDKLESFREDIKGNSYTVSDDTVTEVLRECELCFVQLNKRIKAGDDEAKRAHITNTSSAGGDGTSRAPHVAATAGPGRTTVLARSHMMGSVANLLPPELDETASRMNTLRPYNQRIDLSTGDEHRNSAGVYAAYDPNGGGDDNSLGDLEDDELTREKVKRASSQILQAMDKRKKRPKKKMGNSATIDEDAQSVGSRPKDK